MSIFNTKHNILFRKSDHLNAIVKNICPESEVIQQLTCNRTKTTAIVNNTSRKNKDLKVEKLKTQHLL